MDIMKFDLDHTISKPVENPDMVVLSLGAGVQSTTMALLAAKGLIGPMPEHMIFADTGWEPESVYDHLDWLESEVKKLSGNKTEVHRVAIGSIRENIIKGENSTGQKMRSASVPFYTQGGGMAIRQCTNEYKIQPIQRKIRELNGISKGKRAPKDLKVEQWIGISRDEIQRVKEHHTKYIVNRWPLLEIGWRRYHCLEWFAKEYPGRTLAKSACIGCPYTDDQRWADMKENDPVSFEDACKIDEIIRDSGGSSGKMKNKQYIHRSCKPLREVDFDNQDDQIDFGFINECDGMCGI